MPNSKKIAGNKEENGARKGARQSHPQVEQDQITMDRRAAADRRSAHDRRKADVPVETERRKLQRRVKVTRRRQIDPTTCERDYTPDEIEFMGAIEEYKRRSGRMFPTCSEVLEVLRGLGYAKQPVVPAEACCPTGQPEMAQQQPIA